MEDAWFELEDEKRDVGEDWINKNRNVCPKMQTVLWFGNHINHPLHIFHLFINVYI